MARQWFIPSGVMPLSDVMIDEDGEDEYFIPALGMFNEDQAKAAGNYSVLGPGAYPRPPYGSFAGKAVAGGAAGTGQWLPLLGVG